MKNSLVLLIVVQILGISTAVSQTKTEKPTTDACPTWNKKKTNSKADYFNYLSKRNAAKDNADFYTPKYQRIVSKKGTTASHAPNKKAVPMVASAEKKQQPKVASQEKNKSSKSIREASTKKVEAPIKESNPQVIKPATTEPIAEKGKATTAAPTTKKKVQSTKKNEMPKTRTHSFKKLRFGKKKATDCPDF
jgi:hypothetical protein